MRFPNFTINPILPFPLPAMLLRLYQDSALPYHSKDKLNFALATSYRGGISGDPTFNHFLISALTTTPLTRWGKSYYPHFILRETKVQRS